MLTRPLLIRVLRPHLYRFLITAGGIDLGILAWIIFGLIAGAIAQLIMPGDDPGGSGFMGWLITMIIGIVGAVVGGFIGTALGFGDVDGFNIGSFLIAIVGALIVLAIWRLIAGRGSHGNRRFA